MPNLSTIPSDRPNEGHSRQLLRTLDLGSVVAISTGAMLGSGIFVLPGLATEITGSSVWLAYVVAGVCVLPAALCTAELATAMPTSGGKYVFIDRTFGPLAGTVSGIGLWLTLLLKSAFALVGFGVYFGAIVDLPLQPTALTLLCAIVALNLLGSTKVSVALKLVVGLCVLGLFLLVGFGVGQIEANRLQDPLPNGALGFAAAVGFVFVSFAGVTKVAAIAEEVKDPNRNLPLGMLVSLATVTFLYGMVVLVLVGTVPAAELAGDLHPIYLMAQNLGGPRAATMVAILAVLTMTSMANAGLLAASRFPFAMSRDDLLPRYFSAVNRRFHTPSRAILVSGLMIAATIVLVEVDAIAKLASSFLIIIFIAVNCAVIVLRESDAQWYRPPFHAPLYPALHVFGILAGLFLLYTIGGLALLAALVIALPGTIFYALYGRHRTSRRSVVRKLGDWQPTGKDTGKTPPKKEMEALHPTVAVVLFGLERSPETVVEIGTALSQKQPLSVSHITELPEQIFLTSGTTDELKVFSLQRRITAMAAKTQVDIRFRASVTHDLVAAVRQVSESAGCEWVLKEWRRGGGHGVVLHSPLAWSLYRLRCNLALFKDAGVRYIRSILGYIEPGPNDALVAGTCDHLARLWDAELTFVRFVRDDATQTQVQAQIDYISELQHLCRQQTSHCLLRGTDELKTLVDVTAGFDLLVMGEANEGFLRTVFWNKRERLTDRAACSVLRLKTPRASVHEGFREDKTHSEARAASILDFMSPHSVAMRLPVTSKEALFRQIGEVLGQSLGDLSPRAITRALWTREEMQNTAVGDGLALPHGTLDALERPLVGIVTTAKPVAYGGPEELTVQVCIVTLCPPSKRQIHLKLLARVARLVERTDFVARQRKAQTKDEAMQALQDCMAKLDDQR